MLHDKDNSQAFNNPNCPEFDTCFDLKIAMSQAEKDAQKEEISEGALKRTAGGSPNESFGSLDALLAKHPEDIDIPIEDYSNPYRGTKLVRGFTDTNGNQVAHVFFYNLLNKWQDNGVYQGVIVSPDDPTINEIKETIRVNREHSDENDTLINNRIDEIDIHQDLQDKRLDNHNDRLNDLEDILHETTVTEVEETFNGNKFDVPTSVEVEGRNFGVIDNQLFKISGIKGQSRKINQYADFKAMNLSPRAGLTFVNNNDGTLSINGTTNDSVSVKLNNTFIGLKGKVYFDLGAKFDSSEYNEFYLVQEYDKTTTAYIRDVFRGTEATIIDFNTENRIAFSWFAYSGLVTNKKIKPVIANLTEMFGKGNEPTSVNDARLNIFKENYIPYTKKNTLQDTTIKNITSIGANRIPFPYRDINKPMPTNGITFKVEDDGSVTLNGTSTGVAYFVLYSGKKFNKGSYWLSCNDMTSNQEVRGNWYVNPSDKHYFGLYDDNGIQLNLPEGAIMELEFTILENRTFNNVNYKPMLKIGTNKESYKKPVKDETITINSTLKGIEKVYDEAILTKTPNTELYEVDVITKMASIDLSKLNWVNDSSSNEFYAPLPASATPIKKPINNETDVNAICSKYPIQSAAYVTDGELAVNTSGVAVVIDGSYNNDLAAFKKDMEGVILTYEIATPTTKKVSNLALGDVSVLGQKGGEFQVNPIEPNIVEPLETRMKFDIKYWEEPVGGR